MPLSSTPSTSPLHTPTTQRSDDALEPVPPELRAQFERLLALAQRQRKADPGESESGEPGAKSLAALLQHELPARIELARDVAGVDNAPRLAMAEFAAALDRLQAPVPVAGVPSQWEFTLDAGQAPLAAVRVREAAGGGWNVALMARAVDRPLLKAHLDSLRLRLTGRSARVDDLSVDDSEH